MKRFVSLATLALCAVFAHPVSAQDPAALVPATPVESSVNITAPATNTAGWVATVRLTFTHPEARVTRWGEPVKNADARTITLDVDAAQPAQPSPLTVVSTARREYALGRPAAGTWKVRLTLRGALLAEKSFTVPGVTDPALEAKAGLTFDTANPAVTARAHVEFQSYYAVRSQAPVTRDSAGRFVLEATVEPVAVIAIFPPPPYPVADLTYALGSVAPGTYGAVFRMNGKAFAEGTFTVASTPPPVPAAVTMTFDVGADAVTGKARVVFPDGYWSLESPGTPVREGNRFVIDARAVPIQTLVPPNGPAIFEPVYPFGPLPAGAYTVNYRLNGQTRGEFAFVVPPAPPPPPTEPTLAFLNIRQGNASTVAEAGLLLPAGQAVISWGEPHREGNAFSVTVTTGPVEVANPNGQGDGDANVDPLPGLVAVQTHAWSLGVLEAGAYKFTLALADGAVLGVRDFRVEGVPPSPVPPPLVSSLEISGGNPGWVADLALILPRPDVVITDWGAPARDGSKIRVRVSYGLAPVVGPIDPVPGNATEGADAGGETTSLAGWPVALVRHRYELGTLEPGTYAFVVVFGDRVAAQRTFTLPPVTQPRPVAELEANPITSAGTEPHAFAISFSSTVGWRTPPTDAAVTVTGPGGFSAVAKLTGSVASMDALGRFVRGLYALEPPGGAWDAADNGEYTVSIDREAVADANGNTLAAPRLGAFAVRIAPTPPPPPHRAEVTLSMSDGMWSATVEFANTGDWFAADWGEVRTHGLVSAAFAALRTLPPGSAAPIPASFSHTYELGALAPGPHAFVFKSSAGHCAIADVVVPGVVPPTAFDAWRLNTTTDADAADADGDGLSLAAEYFFAGNPSRPDVPHVAPQLVGESGSQHLALEFRRVVGAETDVTCRVEVSRDMLTWQDGGDAVEWRPGPADVDGTQLVCVCQKSPVGVTAWPFMRLVVAPAVTP